MFVARALIVQVGVSVNANEMKNLRRNEALAEKKRQKLVPF